MILIITSIFELDGYVETKTAVSENKINPKLNAKNGIDSFKFSELGEQTTKISDCLEDDVNYQGEDINNGLYLLTKSAIECQWHCQQNNTCEAFTWADPDSFP